MLTGLSDNDSRFQVGCLFCCLVDFELGLESGRFVLDDWRRSGRVMVGRLLGSRAVFGRRLVGGNAADILLLRNARVALGHRRLVGTRVVFGRSGGHGRGGPNILLHGSKGSGGLGSSNLENNIGNDLPFRGISSPLLLQCKRLLLDVAGGEVVDLDSSLALT